MISPCTLLKISFVVTSSLLTTSLAQNLTTVPYYTENNDASTPERWKTYIGGQNFTWCCIKAVAESIIVYDNDNWTVLEDRPIKNLDYETLYNATQQGQFPCTAEYSSDEPEGAPEIIVPYTWYADTCPGWQLSSGSNLNGWLQPLSGFLLPAVIFCLSIPRRRKFHVFRAFFVPDIAGITSYVPAFLGAIFAMLIVTLDTAVWLSICWALSGPMVLSGLYEALLDNRIVEFVRTRTKCGNLTVDMRCRLLMLVLIGNLDLAIEDQNFPDCDDPAHPDRTPQHYAIPRTMKSSNRARGDEMFGGNKLDHSHVCRERRSSDTSRPGRPGSEFHLEPLSFHLNPVRDVDESQQKPMSTYTNRLDIASAASTVREESNSNYLSSCHPSQPEQMQPLTAASAEKEGVSPWWHMENLLYSIRRYDDENTRRNLSPRQYPIFRHQTMGCDNPACTEPAHFQLEADHQPTEKTKRQIRKTKTRLRTMLNCQYSFGSMVGAPVVFFLGGFVFTLLQSIQSIGDEDTALALAFGQWYMTIPHIAIISGLLLAGNNPNILEGVFAKEKQEKEEKLSILGLDFGLAYPSCYKVAWQWHRGYNKLLWVQQLYKIYGQEEHDKSAVYDKIYNKPAMEDLRERTTMSLLDWFAILSMAAVLLGLPFVLAFITAFYTPEVGVSCRSFTFLIYACAELGEVVLWLWAYALPHDNFEEKSQAKDPKRDPGPLDFFRRQGWLHKSGFYDPTNVNYFLNPRERRMPQAILKGVTSRNFRQVRSIWCCIWYISYIIFGIIATFAALGGTVMQLMGVYSAGICQITVDKWLHLHEPGVTTMISVNTKVMIQDAQTYWKPCAITAISFMTFVSFVGWWYQRRMKDIFTDLVSKVDSYYE